MSENNTLSHTTSTLRKELDTLTDGYKVVTISGKKVEICTNYHVQDFKFPSGAFIYHPHHPDKLVLCVGTGRSSKPKVTPESHLWVLREGDDGITPIPREELQQYVQQPLQESKKVA